MTNPFCTTFFSPRKSLIPCSYFFNAPLTSVKLQLTALPFLSTWGRRKNSRPPCSSSRVGSCLESGERLTLYLSTETCLWRFRLFYPAYRSLSNYWPSYHIIVYSSRENQAGSPFSSSCMLSYVYFPKFESSTVIPAKYMKELDFTCL